MVHCFSLQSDHEASLQHFTEVVAERDKEISVLKGRIDGMVESLQQEEYDRQRDDEGHGEVIQELQRMLGQERREKGELRAEVCAYVRLRCFMPFSRVGLIGCIHVHCTLVACAGKMCTCRDVPLCI